MSEEKSEFRKRYEEERKKPTTPLDILLGAIVGPIIVGGIFGFLYLVGSNIHPSPELQEMNERTRERIESEQGLKGESYFDKYKYEDGSVQRRE